MSNALAIETQALTKRYGRQTAVDALSLSVPCGSVFAFLGRNGAGKTTTIQILLDLLNRTSGEARVLGRDCVKQAIDIRRRTGYVADGQRMYDWMKVDEIIWYCRGFYPAWDDAFAAELKAKLELPGEKKIGQMSRGMQAKLALAAGHGPPSRAAHPRRAHRRPGRGGAPRLPRGGHRSHPGRRTHGLLLLAYRA